MADPGQAGKRGTGIEALWELRPLERRPDGLRSSVETPKSHGGAADEARSVCFATPSIFGGCTICAVDDDEFVRSRPVVERLHAHWETGSEVFCSTAVRRGCGSKLDEYIEEVEETTSLGDDEHSVVSGEAGGEAGASADQQHAELPLRGPEAQEIGEVQCELEAVRRTAADIFLARGWDLERISGDRYRLNGRSARLTLLPLGAPVLPFTHILKVVDCEAAQRAARILVHDGSLTQPLLDYLLHTGQNELYDQRGTENIAGVHGPAKFLDFNVAGTDDRILEMRSALIQADMRRSADGEGERISALQSEGVKLLGRAAPGSACGSAALFSVSASSLHSESGVPPRSV